MRGSTGSYAIMASARAHASSEHSIGEEDFYWRFQCPLKLRSLTVSLPRVKLPSKALELEEIPRWAALFFLPPAGYCQWGITEEPEALTPKSMR